MADTPADNGTIDKKALWGNYQKWVDRQDRFKWQAAHKALDMSPVDDDMRIDASRTGIGAGGAVGIAAATGIPAAIAAGLLGYILSGSPAQPSQPIAATPPPDSAYDIVFYDEQGNQIKVDHISTKPK